jgi:hypothetical protein
MDRVSVTSSNLRSVGYDADTSTLEIEFNSGEVYQYQGVPEGEYDALLNAGSHGSYFAGNIKNRYSFFKV